MKREYEMTQADLEQLYEAMKPVPLIVVGGTCGPSQQERANDAWQMLGDKMGFDHMSVEPISGKGERFFRATPVQSEVTA